MIADSHCKSFGWRDCIDGFFELLIDSFLRLKMGAIWHRLALGM